MSYVYAKLTTIESHWDHFGMHPSFYSSCSGKQLLCCRGSGWIDEQELKHVNCAWKK